jgi:hypothetical protein
MSDIISTANAVLGKTRCAWSIPGLQREPTRPLPILDGHLFMNKKTHSTHDVPGSTPGDYAGDHNKASQRKTTQLNQPHRTPGSRSDRDDHLGSNNQSRRRHSGTQRGG